MKKRSKKAQKGNGKAVFTTQDIVSICIEVRNPNQENIDAFKITIFDCFVGSKFNYRGARVYNKRGDIIKYIKKATIKEELIDKVSKMYNTFTKFI